MPIGEDDIQAWVDGRLGAERARLVADYLAAHPAEGERAEAMRADRAALRRRLAEKANEPVPAHLRIAAIRQRRWRRRGEGLRRAAAALLLLGLGAAGGWLARPGAPADAPRQFAAIASDAYRTFAVDAVRPVEVAASEETQLVRWLSKRTGVALVPPDLGGFGYVLLGGRVLPGGGAAAAQLMYEGPGGDRLTVYLRPGGGDGRGDGGEAGFTFAEEGGAATFVWVDGGFDFAVTAGLDRAQLFPIAAAVFRDLAGAPGPKA